MNDGKTLMESLIRELLKAIGEDPEREGLRRTPHRVAQMYEDLTQGYKEDIKTLVEGSIFEEQYDEMVLEKNIDMFSLCEHHLLPFYGVCHIGYIPDGKIVGLSKIPRIVEAYSRRLQVQERLTVQIASTIQELLNPRGVGVVITARHLCMMMRGVKKQNTVITTSSMLGLFRSDPRTRAEFMSLITQAHIQF